MRASSLVLGEPLLASWRRGRCCATAPVGIPAQRLRLDARAQALVALLRHSLRAASPNRWKRRAWR